MHHLLSPSLPLFFRHLVSVVIFFLTLIFSSSLVQGRRSPGNTLAWLLAIILIPYVGLPLYLLFGGRKILTAAAKKTHLYQSAQKPRANPDIPALELMLSNFGVPPKTIGNQILVIEDGVRAYKTLLQMIGDAQESIFVETFILGADEVGVALLKSLIAKAKQGIEVRLLVDAFGMFRQNRKLVKELTAAGGRVVSFMPFLHMPFRGRTNLRDHRKITLIDKKIALAGGMNIAHEYMGATPDPRRWTDLALQITGPAVQDLEKVFYSDWAFAVKSPVEKIVGGNSATEESPRPTEPSQSAQDKSPTSLPIDSQQSLVAQVVASGPDVQEDALYDAILSAIFEASQRIWIATPYFIPDESLTRALELACRRGIDVRILIPASSNHILADFSRGSYLRQIQSAGGKILMYPKMLHAKATVFDSTCAIVGSANMDMRSLFLNYEVCVFLYSQPSIQSIEKWFEVCADRSRLGYKKLRWGTRLVEGIGRILGPML